MKKEGLYERSFMAYNVLGMRDRPPFMLKAISPVKDHVSFTL